MSAVKALLKQIHELSIAEKLQLMTELPKIIQAEWETTRPTAPSESLYGLCSDLGIAPSQDEMDQARHEVWQNFPREDI